MEGIVKFYNLEKAYGFLSYGDNKECFVHVSGCLEEIAKGDKVSFDITVGKRGDQAANVKLL